MGHLLSMGAQLNATDVEGKQLLHIFYINSITTQLLISLKADVNATNPTGHPPIQLAVAMHSLPDFNSKMINLIMGGARFCMGDEFGRLVTRLNKDIEPKLIQALKAKSIIDSCQVKPPSYESAAGEIPDKMLARIEDSGESFKMPPLFPSSFIAQKIAEGNMDFIGLYFTKENVNSILILPENHNLYDLSMKKPSPLHVAAAYNQVEVIGHLIYLGANPNVEDERRNKPLHDLHINAITAQLLVSLKADINSFGIINNTPLLTAMEARNKIQRIEKVKYLIMKGANIDAANIEGMTPREFIKYHDPDEQVIYQKAIQARAIIDMLNEPPSCLEAAAAVEVLGEAACAE